MRKIAFAMGLTFACLSNAWGADSVVHLNGPEDLAQLRTSNPGHYRQALVIIRAADKLCRPHAGELEKTDVQQVSCSQMLLRPSNPAKRDVTFRLDQTTYIAQVTLTDDPPKLVAATSR